MYQRPSISCTGNISAFLFIPVLQGGALNKKLLICIPTYNEAQNIEPLLNAVFAIVSPETEILVVDDNSPDGTAKIVEGLIPSYPNRLHLLNRPSKQGLAAAYLAAFEWGLSHAYEAFLEMDADFSHNPKYIPQMLSELGSHDVVIGSRNIKGGGAEGWSILRHIVSKGGSLYSRLILGCPIKDLTGGFNMFTKTALEKIELKNIISKGYSFQIEMKYRAWNAGCSVKEIPIIFVNRKKGISKMSKKIFLEAFISVWKIKNTFVRSIDQLIKFAVTGGLGTLTNLTIFFLCVDIGDLPTIRISILCFLIAVTQNYIINHKWSFKSSLEEKRLSIKRWLRFIGISLLGLFVNLFVMKTLLTNFTLPYKVIAQAVGIAAGMAVNFVMAKLFVFRKKIWY